jgi:hypothetical protein
MSSICIMDCTMFRANTILNLRSGLYHDKHKYEDIAVIAVDDFVPSPLCL